jgi:hypothetical protein
MTGKNTLRKLNSLEIETFIQNAFLMCEQKKLFHWGVYPVHNAFYMKLGVSHIAFINGSFSGYIKDGILFDEEMPLKEDYDFSARQIKKHGAILRFNFVAADAAHRNNKGGAFEIRKENENLEIDCALTLIKRHPELIRMNPSRIGEVILSK